MPSFKEVFGHSSEGITLTRVERQMASGKVPTVVSTIARLRAAADFNPFDKLVPIGVGHPEPNPDQYDFAEYAQGYYLRHLIEQFGAHRTRQIVNDRSKRNASRIFEKFSEFLPCDGSLVSPASLYERYRESVSHQLAA